MVRFPTVTPLPTVIAPPAPPEPKMALLPFSQTLSSSPSDQLVLAVDQLPAPSVGAVGFAPLASHVTVAPWVRGRNNSKQAKTTRTTAFARRPGGTCARSSDDVES